jgi:FkbM family methyltransferase
MRARRERRWAAALAERAMRRPPPAFLGDRLLAQTIDGHAIFLATDDLDLTPHLLLRGAWEPHVGAALRRLLRPGAVAADIGANVGAHTLAMAQAVGPRGRIEAFEANPAAARLLADSLFVNGVLPWVTLHRQAVTDRAGELLLTVTPGHLGSGNLHPGAAVPDHDVRYPQQLRVPAVRLDEALGGLPRLDLIRLDIEGAEPLALRGAEALLRRHQGIRVVLEWSVPMLSSRMQVPGFVAWLKALGFRFWVIEAEGRLRAVTPAEATALPHADLLLARDAPA